ncbi:MAG: hypothetical protein ACI4XB_09275 [Ruminococcus sp.]
MTERELHRLRRTELLELLLETRKELDAVKQDNDSLRQQLDAARENQELLENIAQSVRETAVQVQTLLSAASAVQEKPDTESKAEQ